MNSLDVLAQHRDALLLAEIAALIHDWKKCSDEQLKSMTKSYFEKGMNGNETLFKQRCPSTDLDEIKEAQGIPRTEFNKLFSKLLEQYPVLNLGGKGYKFDEFVSSRKHGFRGQEDPNLDYPILLARVAHHRAHIEKEKEDTDFEGAQCWPNIRASNAFGFEDEKPLSGLTKILYGLGEDKDEDKDEELSGLGRRKNLLDDIKKKWDVAIADSRRPVNEVNLWDWSYVVAALYKSEIARWLLTNEKRDPDKISWRLLAIRTDGLQYMLSAPAVPDILARKDLVQDGWDKVKELIEEQYPLGLEVYRDENGPVYVVPDIDNLTSVLVDKSKGNKKLREFICEAFSKGTVQGDRQLHLGGELIPQIKEDGKGWKAEGDDIPPIEKHLDEKIGLESDPFQLRDAWCNGHIADICTVCGLRPQGPGKKSAERNVCDICEQRRDDRARKWATGLGKTSLTIWTDEVADKNGRLALLVGSFELTHWLSGNLVRTLAVRAPKDNHTSKDVSKNPSFARLRRIWETTRNFWAEVAPIKDDCLNGRTLVENVLSRDSIRNKRLVFKGRVNADLGPYHSYELVIDGKGVPVLWDPERRAFITTVNLEWLKKELLEKEEEEQKENLIIRLRKLNENVEVSIQTPGGYGEESRNIGSLTIENIAEGITFMDGEYLPIVPILNEPSTFILLLSAEDAMSLVQEIRKKYEREMGKVRNRLPMHLSLIFAHKRTPLRALFDAGRQALARRGNASDWTVINVENNLIPDFLQNDPHFKTSKLIVLDRNGRKVTWRVPLTMGDGQTEDVWYPYVLMQNTEQPKKKSLWFELTDDQWKNPWNEKHKYQVYAGEVQQGEKVYFTPSTFDFEFLDVTSRRFEMYYDDDGQRASIKRRPYLLDELDEWGQMVSHLNHLERHQVYQTVQMLEATRELWGVGYPDSPEEETVFSQFVEDTLANAAWPKSHQWMSISKEDRNLLVKAGVNGVLKDVVELYFQILKTKFNAQPVKSS